MAALYAFIFSGAVKYFSVKAFGLTHCIEMLKLTIPFVPNGIMWWLVGALNRPLMEKHLGMYAIGIFAVANKFPGILTTIFSIFNKPWQISVLEEFGKKNYSLFYNKVFRILVTLLIFCFFIITISSKLIIKIFAAEEFFEAYAYVPILTIGTVFSSIASFVGSNFSASRESKYFLYSTVLGAASSVALNFIFIPLFGIMGAAVSVALSFIVIALLRIINSWKYVHIVNIPIYIAMFFLSLALITVMLIKEMWLYWCLLVLIFGLFGMLNYDLKNDFLKIFEKYKTKLIKKCD
jgi:O-antigen/teichoic acid export membrane protein